MENNKKLRILVVDDSLLFRELISLGISSDPWMEVVAKAVDPFDARDKILEFNPDVMVCDVEMPKMNGVEFIKRLLPQYPIPVVVVSSLSEAVFDAMSAGAVDFITKPDGKSGKSLDSFIYELKIKIKIASVAKIGDQKIRGISKQYEKSSYDTSKIIAIGASTGGTDALYKILKNLPSTMPGIIIVQHIPPVFSKMFSQRLNSETQLNVKEAQTGDYIEPGTVIIAPGDEHIRIKKVGHRYRIECFKGKKVNGHCPSVDVLFESVAKEAGSNSIGIILTGMGNDGAKGLLAMRKVGAHTLGQDENSCVVYGMPKAAFDIGAVEKQVSLGNIPSALHFHLQVKKI